MQATKAGGIDSFESIPGLLERLKIRARSPICKAFTEPRNRFRAWRAVTATLFDVPVRQAGYIGWRIRFLGSLRLQIRAQRSGHTFNDDVTIYSPSSSHRRPSAYPNPRFFHLLLGNAVQMFTCTRSYYILLLSFS
jgi:hypothetical protein